MQLLHDWSVNLRQISRAQVKIAEVAMKKREATDLIQIWNSIPK